MSYRKSEVFEPPGKVGRKTGFFLTRTPKKNENGLEDLKDFFLSDEEYESPNNQKINTSPNKRLSQRYQQLKAHKSQAQTPTKSPKSRPAKPKGSLSMLLISSSDEDQDKSDSDDADEIINAATQMGSPIRPNVRKKASVNGSPASSQLQSVSKSPKSLQPSPLKKDVRPGSKSSILDVDSEEVSEDEPPVNTASKSTRAHQFASITKNMALQKKPAKTSKLVISDQESEPEPEEEQIQESADSDFERSDAHDEGVVDNDEDEEVVSISEDSLPLVKQNDNSVEEVSRPKEETPVSDSGVRRSSRTRVTPVAWWRNEKIIYETRTENGTYVKQIKDVLHRPEAKPVTRKRRQSSVTPTTKTRRRSRTPRVQSEEPVPAAVQPKIVEQPVEEQKNEQEEAQQLDGGEWLQKNSLTIPVFEGPGSENQIERTVAWAPNKSKNISIIKNSEEFFRIATLFDQDSEFSGGGIIEIPVGSRKAIKSNDDTYFIFFVIQGVLEVTLSHSPFVVVSGCSFEVPMGNFYQFDNKGKTVVKLFFVQSKYVVVSSPEDDDDEDDEDSM
ncbi:hypothetical protein OGAPHI_005251 [Ogataea philodendri]|uniref:Mif2/CENP-C cupin domain-containing protein n=1 Tax=Ogataea philodendri TaxID=1378263 RepID=A0A9P8P102_9ASCO|nr:uncharacterized protein OGAPHI_005251 [Ogataea philodendri]KAH3663848.1 hypothetical protein OGAPHI_005251 [Ogataea philodendri]